MADEMAILRTILFEGNVAGNIVSFLQSREQEVGYWIGRQYWGKGIATEALRQFLEQLEMRPLYAHVAKHNAGSRRVLEKCGFRVLREDKGYAVEPETQVVDEFVMVLDDRSS